MTSAAQYCFDLVRTHDKDRFLASLFAPEDKRPLLLALYAFNIEIARIRDSMSETHLGEIRQQWWRESLDDLYAERPADHPVLQELRIAVSQGNLPKTAFLNLIDARQFDLYADAMPTLGDLEGYLGETAASLIQLGAVVLAGLHASDAAEASGLAGVAFGLAGILRQLPLHRARRQCYVPRDVLAKHGLTEQDIFAGGETPAVAAAIRDLIDVAAKRLAEARQAGGRIAPDAKPAFLHVGLTDLYLARLRKLAAKALDIPADVAQWRRQIRLLRLAKSGGSF